MSQILNSTLVNTNDSGNKYQKYISMHDIKVIIVYAQKIEFI